MRHLLTVYLCLATTAWAATDYSEITTFTGPCARELAVMAREGDIKSTRDQARALCRSETTKACPDLWLVYAYTEAVLGEPGAVAVNEETIRRLPKSAAAHLLHSMAIMQDMVNTGGLVRALKLMGKIRRALEMALDLDPDCHPAREMLILLYSYPKFIGGDQAKFKHHLNELERRNPYHGAMAHAMIAYQRKKDYLAAANYYREALRLKPRELEPVKGMIRASADMGDFDEAFALCSKLTPEFPGHGVRDDIFVELSAKSGLRADEALAASERYLKTAKGVAPMERGNVLINTTIILKKLGRDEEAERFLAKAEAEWAVSRKEFHSREKQYRGMSPVVATQ